MSKKTILSIAAGLLLSLLPSCEGKSGDHATVQFIAGIKDKEQIRLCADQSTLDKVVEALSAKYPDQAAKGLPGLGPCVNNLFAYSYPDPNPSDDLAAHYLSDIFKLNNGDIKQIATGFRATGFLNCGRIPVVRPGEAPSILDADLNEVFKAEEVNGIPVKSVASAYSEGLLWFSLEDGNGGCFDTEGNVAFLLDHQPLMPSIRSDQYFIDGFVFMLYNQKNATIDKNGNVMWTCKGGQRVGNSIIVTTCVDFLEGRINITEYSPSGEIIREKEFKGEEPPEEETPTDKMINEAFEMALNSFSPFDIKSIVSVSDEDSIRFDRLSACERAGFLLKYSLRSDIPKKPFEFSALKREETKNTSEDLVLTDKGLGNLTLEMSKASIPATVSGLYDSKSYTRINHDECMDCPSDIHGYYTCSLKGKEMCYIYISNKNTVCGIYVTTPSIKSSEGVKTGMSTASVKKIAGMNYEQIDMGNSYYVGKAGIEYILYDDNPDIISAMAAGLYY